MTTVVNLAEIDLNLLVAFEALLIERSVGRAALRIGVAQPTMSRSLAQLREVFHDELFIRTPEEMRPTERARYLALPIRDILKKVRSVLEMERTFDPAGEVRRFVIGGMYHTNFTRVPRFVQMLAREAPGVEISCTLLRDTDEAAEMLDRAALDLAIGAFRSLPRRFRSQQIGTEKLACIARRDHPALLDGLNLDTFLKLPHVRISQFPDAGEEIDEALARRNRKRHIKLTLPSFFPLALAVEYSDMLAVIPSVVAQSLALHMAITIHDVPIDVPEWPLMMAWTAGNEQDPGIAWLRDFAARLHVSAALETA